MYAIRRARKDGAYDDSATRVAGVPEQWLRRREPLN
jgi:hypothetical protein